MASTTAPKPSPAAAAVFLAVHMTVPESIRYTAVQSAVKNASHKEIPVAYKLMTWIKVPFWSDCKILIACSAARKPFNCTGPVIQVYVKMIEAKLTIGTRPLQAFIKQPVVFI